MLAFLPRSAWWLLALLAALIWFAGLDGLRGELFPRARGAYDLWRRGDGGSALAAAAAAGAVHWKRVCDTTLFDMSNYSSGFQPFVQLQKTAATVVPAVTIERIRIKLRQN